ncbi:MAG: 8-amino-7-oxononanoate synthase [Verrucomicrobiales bacterium]|nr:8-amino-7-oxononanoate synthase [Verrucomicrobiales bacterium]|tara:strand:- start:23221 stop:24375 length:1155 start_codon:yes stop_codon:yes gene_type:complete
MRDPDSEIQKLKKSNLYREIKFSSLEAGTTFEDNGSKFLNFSSNDYLGLCSHHQIKEAARNALNSFGVGSGASRLISGGTLPHQNIEKESAEFFDKEAALYFTNGYCASVGTLGSILQKGDTVILDKLCHASLIDGSRLSGATLRTFPHNDLEKLERILKSVTDNKVSNTRILIVTEGIFSMDGDSSPILEIIKLKKKYKALLLVDEAHSFGIYGDKGKGIVNSKGLQNDVDFIIATFGKSAGAAGAITASSRIWRDLIINKARSFIYSTAPMPSQAAAALEGLRIIQSNEGDLRRKKLKKNITSLCDKLNLDIPAGAIIPIIIGDEETALKKSKDLMKSGILAPAIRYPTVAKGSARIRITISSNHTKDCLLKLSKALMVSES